MKRIATTLLFMTGLTLAACTTPASQLNETGNAAFVEQDYAAALDAYGQALEEDPSLAEAAYNAANAYYRQGEFEQAAGTIQKALNNADPDLSMRGYYNLGNSHFSREEFEMAVGEYKEALRLDPQDLDAKVNLELALQQLEQQEQEQQDQEQQDQEQQDQEQQDQEQQDQEQQDQEQQDRNNRTRTATNNRSKNSKTRNRLPVKRNQNSRRTSPNKKNRTNRQKKRALKRKSRSQTRRSRKTRRAMRRAREHPSRKSRRIKDPPEQEQPVGPGQMVQAEGLTEEQAEQLLAAAAQGTETLQEHLQQFYLFPAGTVDEDW